MLDGECEPDRNERHTYRDAHPSEQVDHPVRTRRAIHVALRDGQENREVPERAKTEDAPLQREVGIGQDNEATFHAMGYEHLSEQNRHN